MAGTPITVAHGDGIGPEIMDATLQHPEAGGRAPRDRDDRDRREGLPARQSASASSPAPGNRCAGRKVFLKAPITTPQGGGFKSLNVTTRKTLGLYANIRPCVSYHPYVDTKHPGMDVVIVRENEEDLYAGIEHQQTARCGAVPEADLAAGLGEDRPLRVRVRAPQQPQEGHLLHQRQHHEDDRRPLPQGLRRDRRRVSGHREGALDRRHRRREDGRHAGSVRRHRDAESVRRHPLRRRRADRRLGRAGRLGQHRRPVRDVRSDSRLGAAACRAEPGQPVRAAARRR